MSNSEGSAAQLGMEEAAEHFWFCSVKCRLLYFLKAVMFCSVLCLVFVQGKFLVKFLCRKLAGVDCKDSAS